MSTTEISERTAAARREAEQLKDRIKQKKEALADTTRTDFLSKRENKPLKVFYSP